MTLTAALAGVVSREALSPGSDTGRWAAMRVEPEAVVSPVSAEEVAAVLEWAHTERVGVVPVGSGRRLAAGAAEGRVVLLSTERLVGFEVYEPADLTFTARAGTPLREVDRRLRGHGQWLPFDPPAVLERTLGGLVAVGDSGPLWMGYGALRNHVLGMKVVTGDGRLLSLGGRVVKNVAGFDLLKPLVGSRGRLAVITSVCMRAFPEPAVDCVLRLRGRAPGDLVALALKVATAPVLPVSCSLTRDGESGSATLRVRLHGSEPTVEADRRTLEAHLERSLERVDAGERREASVGSPSGDATPTPAGDAAREASHTPVEIVLTFLPSRLRQVVDALALVDATTVSIDTGAARARIGLELLDAAIVGRLRQAVESVGGALAVERAPIGSVDAARVESAAGADEKELEERVARVFDPRGVLWRRRQ